MKKIFWPFELFVPPLLVLLVAVSLFNAPTRAQTGGACTGGCLQGISINLILQGTSGKVGIAYAGILTPSGGNSSNGYSFTLVSGNLPAGTSLATCVNVKSCSIAGTPITRAVYSFNIQITDSAGNTGPSGGFPFTVGVASLSSTALTSATGYSLSVGGTAQGICTGAWSDSTFNNLSNLPGTSWGTSVPADVSVSSSGLFTGVSAGSSNGTCAFAGVTSPNVAFTTGSGTLVISTASLANGQVNQIYPEPGNPAQQLQANGGVKPYTWSLQSGTMPTGVTLTAATGLISGTATNSGTFSSLVFKVTDSATPTPNTATVTLQIIIATISSISVDCTPSPACRAMNQGQQLQFKATATYSDSGSCTPSPACGMNDVTNQTSGTGSPIATPPFATAIGSDYTGTAFMSLTSGNQFNAVVGKVAVLKCKAGLNSNNFNTPTDLAGNVWTLQGTVTSFSGGNKVGIWTSPITVANANDTVTCNYSATAAFLSLILGEYNNPAASSFIDGTPTILSNASSNTITTTGILSTNASDYVIMFSDTTATARSFTCPAGYTVEVTTAAGDSALCDETVSVVNTYAPQATFSGAAHANAGSLVLLKGAATTTGWSEADVVGTNVFSVNSAGLVLALNGSSTPNSGTLQACVGATCGTVTVTVTSTGITALNISPLQQTIPVGGSQTYVCKDQNGNVVTNSVFFAIQNPATPAIVTQQGSGLGAATFVGTNPGSASIICHQ